MKKLLIFPFNGNALEAIACINEQYEFIGFIDDSEEKQNIEFHGYKILSRKVLNDYPESEVLAVPGNPVNYKQRKEIISSLGVANDRFAKIFHPNSYVSSLSAIGFNTLIMAGAVVTANSVIGNHVCILPGSVIHHDTRIGDYTLIGSNVSISGNTVIGKNCYIGSGSNIINNVSIGDNSLIGLGSNVISSVKENSRVAGNPARYI